MTFEEFFKIATGTPPYPYQVRLGTDAELAELIRAPTGAGKTAAAVLGWLWRRHLAAPEIRQATPRRLAYCLPMRVLVEQTEREAKKWIENLGKEMAQSEFDIPVHVLMGGVEAEDWFLQPERSAVLIGTQDMLLSRALNRGYAASRFHWPIDFGLLNNDCLWVFDEPQLMGSGVSTSAQLAGLRMKLKTFGPCPSVWMSATLEPTWLDTVDFAGQRRDEPLELTAEDYDPARPLKKRMEAEKTLQALGVSATRDGKDVARQVVKSHVPGKQTLVVLNTVDRAKAVYEAIKKDKAAPKDVLLIHSRFRPIEREKLNKRLIEISSDRIIVATQVVEAGVDLSAHTLVTELAPWSSLVQRIGRCNRTGDDGPGRVFWVDLDKDKVAPYEADELRSARRWLTDLEGKDVSPKALEDFKQERSITLPFEHTHVLRRRDLLDLFDTAPDLSGNDIDVSRFVRGDKEDRDVQVFWRSGPPVNRWDAVERRRQAARREELCNVPIGSFREEFLGAGKAAFRFDHLDGEWREIRKKDNGSILPGQVFWVVADQGGYDREIGWRPASGRLPNDLLIELPARDTKARGRRSEGFYDSDEWSRAGWKTIAEHTDDVVRILKVILRSDQPLPITEMLQRALELAARWHDWGKAHPVFQSGVADAIDNPRETKSSTDQNQSRSVSRPEKLRGCAVVAKARDEFWRPYTRFVPADPNEGRPGRTEPVKRFRHELASALGILALVRAGSPPSDWSSLSPPERLLVLYLIASHHGKVRLSLRTMPGESPIPPDLDEPRFVAGIWEGDRLPRADLGGGTIPPEAVLSLEPMLLGGAESWTAGVLELRDSEEFGPFRLAYLEALLRAADQRASAEGDGTNE